MIKDRRAAAAGILLIVAVLLAGAAACDGAGTVANTYQLAVSSASGGSVATPGAGTFTYDAGMVVQLVATPDDGYQFLSWTGDTQGIANPGAAATTITMNSNYAIVANFDMESGENPDDGGSDGGDPSEGGPYDCPSIEPRFTGGRFVAEHLSPKPPVAPVSSQRRHLS